MANMMHQGPYMKEVYNGFGNVFGQIDRHTTAQQLTVQMNQDVTNSVSSTTVQGTLQIKTKIN